MQEMMIDSIRVSLMNYQRVVILKERTSNRYLPIWIGPAEADAIAVKLQDVSVPRPLTHDLLTSVIQSLGASVSHIIISDLQSDTFYAKLILQQDSGSVEVDCRPSDALALAVRTKVAIYCEQAVMEKAGILLDEEGKPLASQRSGETETEEGDQEPKKVDEEELKRLSAFTDFIEELDIDDLGQGGEGQGR